MRPPSLAIQMAEDSQEKADLLHAIYERVVAAGPEIRVVRLTPMAYARA